MIPTSNINNFNLYIIQTGNIVKIGYSSQMNKRLLSYKHHNPLTELHYLGYSHNAYELERKIHNLIESCYLKEWYDEDKLPNILDFCKQNNVILSPFDVRLHELKNLTRLSKQKKCINYEQIDLYVSEYNCYIRELCEYIQEHGELVRFKTDLNLEDVKKIESRVLFFYENIKTENLAQFIIEYASTESAFTTSKYRVAIQQMLASKAMKSYKLTKVFKAIMGEFVVGGSYRTSEIVKVVRRKIKSYEKKLTLTKEKTLKLFKSLFNTITIQKMIEKNRITFHQILSTNPFEGTIYQPIKNLENTIQDVLDAIR